MHTTIQRPPWEEATNSQPEQERPTAKKSPFIEANTRPATRQQIKENHIIPVFAKDNEPLIDHADFIGLVMELVGGHYSGQQIEDPQIRVSHPIKGRIPEAKGKPAKDLEEDEKTLYYERMAFAAEIPSIQEEVAGQPLSLTIGGVKAYNRDNLGAKQGSPQHFTVFAGFQNTVCINLCVWTDGLKDDIRTSHLSGLRTQTRSLLESFDAGRQLDTLRELPRYQLSEEQFAHVIGRARLHQHLPKEKRQEIPTQLLTDSQLNDVTRRYVGSQHFGAEADGAISLWSVYNLLTGANKSSYIDKFIPREVNALDFTRHLQRALEGEAGSWFLN